MIKYLWQYIKSQKKFCHRRRKAGITNHLLVDVIHSQVHREKTQGYFAIKGVFRSDCVLPQNRQVHV